MFENKCIALANAKLGKYLLAMSAFSNVFSSSFFSVFFLCGGGCWCRSHL